jgi:hypothetical protein
MLCFRSDCLLGPGKSPVPGRLLLFAGVPMAVMATGDEAWERLDGVYGGNDSCRPGGKGREFGVLLRP